MRVPRVTAVATPLALLDREWRPADADVSRDATLFSARRVVKLRLVGISNKFYHCDYWFSSRRTKKFETFCRVSYAGDTADSVVCKNSYIKGKINGVIALAWLTSAFIGTKLGYAETTLKILLRIFPQVSHRSYAVKKLHVFMTAN